MENNQVQSTEINIDLEAIKRDVLSEIEKAGVKIIPSVYDGKEKVEKLIEKFEKTKEEYKEKEDYIKSRYAIAIQNEKLKELKTDFNEKNYWINHDLDTILKTDNQYRLESIKNKQIGSEYKEAKKDTIQLLSLVGDKLDSDMIAEILNPFVEAKDLFTLKILDKLITKNRWVTIGALRVVEQYHENKYMTDLVKATKSYVNGNITNRSLTLESLLATDRK